MSSRTFEDKKNQGQAASGFDFLKGVGQVTGGTLLAITMLTSSIVAGGLVGLAISFRNLPDVRQLRNFFPSETTYVYDVKGKLLFGPYLRDIPANPFNGRRRIRIDGALAGANTHGWRFDSTTRVIEPDDRVSAADGGLVGAPSGGTKPANAPVEAGD